MTLLLSLLLCLAPPAPTGSPVSFEQGKDHLLIQIDGKPFATYAWNDSSIKRPYFAHVRSPRGVPVTRNLPPVEGRNAADHATMHPGLWLAFGDIAGSDFWRNEGVVRHAGFVEGPVVDAQGGSFAVRNLYVVDGKTLCEEVCRIRIGVTPHGTLIDWQSELSGPETFAFGDQEEMGLGVRLATDLTVTKGGVITDSYGRKDEKQVWGQQADWCDYSGRGGGVMLIPDPANFRRSWFHVRDYGLMVANPFGRRAFTRGEPSRVVVERGKTLTLRFGVLVHDGYVDRKAAYRDYLKGVTQGSPRQSSQGDAP